MTVTVGQSPFPRPAVQQWLRSQLDDVRRSGAGRLLTIRGRRQAGKSTAVEQFVDSSGLPYVYVTGLFGVPEREQLAAATEAIGASRAPLPVTAPGAPSSWRDWLTQLALSTADGPVIAVLDEFPWITGPGRTGIDGTLQAVWDRVLEKRPVMLILVGSDVAMMERLAQHDRPLFGRVREFVLPMLTPGEVAAALPQARPTEVFDAWLVTGGYPRLVIELRDAGTSMQEWVRSSFGDDFSPLVATARLTLDAEFPDAETARRVLAAIGAAEQAHLPLGSIVDLLTDDPVSRKSVQTSVLRSLHLLTDDKRLITADLPAWAGSTRLRRYRLTDPYLRFWFRYVERYVDTIARGRGDVAVAAFDRDWPSWRGRAVEPIVREALERLAISDPRLTGVETVQPWWTRDGQVEVDVVGANRERTLLLGTVKWRDRGGVTAHDMSALAQARARVPRSSDAELIAITPSGEAPEGATSFSAGDLLTAWA